MTPDLGPSRAHTRLHALEKELAQLADAEDEEEIRKRLKGLGYIS